MQTSARRTGRFHAPRELLDRAVSGDQPAREELVRLCGPTVWSIARRIDPNPDDAYQEIWEKILRGIPRFDPAGPASIRTWIATVAHRHLVDRHRRRKRRQPLGQASVIPFENASDATPADEQLDRASRNARLDEAIQGLPEHQRTVVVLHHLHGLPLEVIALQEGVATGTIKSRLHRGRATLAMRLRETYGP